MLFILKQLDVQNLTISSEAKQLPLMIKAVKCAATGRLAVLPIISKIL
jgi:hypothetical protein